MIGINVHKDMRYFIQFTQKAFEYFEEFYWMMSTCWQHISGTIVIHLFKGQWSQENSLDFAD